MYREIIYKYPIKNVNLREGKSTNSKIITVIPKMAKIELLDGEEDWLKVKYNNYEGYVYNENISTSLYPWTNVKLREKPSILSKSMLTVPAKSLVQLIGIQGGWSRVIYDDKEGYISSRYLSDDGNKNSEINYKYFYSDMERFVNDNDFASTSSYLLVTDLKNRYTYVFKRENNKWDQLFKFLCTVGKPSTPTITGTFYISGRKPYFGTDKYRVKYATRIRGAYYYHSVLYDSKGNYVIDGRLGQALSHGCIRLNTNNAKWIYDNIPDGTTVFIH